MLLAYHHGCGSTYVHTEVHYYYHTMCVATGRGGLVVWWATVGKAQIWGDIVGLLSFLECEMEEVSPIKPTVHYVKQSMSHF